MGVVTVAIEQEVDCSGKMDSWCDDMGGGTFWDLKGVRRITAKFGSDAGHLSIQAHETYNHELHRHHQNRLEVLSSKWMYPMSIFVGKYDLFCIGQVRIRPEKVKQTWGSKKKVQRLFRVPTERCKSTWCIFFVRRSGNFVLEVPIQNLKNNMRWFI